MRDASRATRLAAFFRDRPGRWVDGTVLGTVAGRYAWRTRISDLRKPPFNLCIENRQRRLANAQGEPYIVSEYRLVDQPADAGIAPVSDDWTLT